MPGLGRAAPARRPLNRDQRAVMPLINNIIGKMEACEAIEERRQLRALLSCPSSLADKGPEAAARASSSNRLV